MLPCLTHLLSPSIFLILLLEVEGSANLRLIVMKLDGVKDIWLYPDSLGSLSPCLHQCNNWSLTFIRLSSFAAAHTDVYCFSSSLVLKMKGQGRLRLGSSLLGFLLIIGARILVATHIARVVSHLFPSCNALALATFIKALLVGTGVLAGVCQTVYSTHCCCLLQARGWV